MQGATKKGVGLLVLLFLGYWLVHDPNGFADFIKSIGVKTWDGLMVAFKSLIALIKSLTE
jgi:hypothetical protein